MAQSDRITLPPCLSWDATPFYRKAENFLSLSENDAPFGQATKGDHLTA
jgi:hypothetical protein